MFEATGDVATRKPVVVLVDRGTASASEIVTAALHERLGAPVVGLRTFGKGVFGQIFDLSNGGALDLVVGNYYTPDGRNLNRQGHQAGRRGHATTRTRSATRRSSARCASSPAGSSAQDERRRAPCSPPAGPPARVGLVAKRGRLTVVEPFFERGTQDGRRPAPPPRHPDRAIWCWCAQARRGRRGGTLEVVRSLGRPDVARDVVEALLYDRGHHRRLPRRDRGRGARGRRPHRTRHRRRDLTALPTFTIDPVAAKDFDDALSVERDGDGLRLYVHIADVAGFVRPGTGLDAEGERRGNSVYVPGAVEPMLPRALSNEACSLVPGVPRRAVTVEMAVDAGRAGAQHRVLPQHDSLRRAARV